MATIQRQHALDRLMVARAELRLMKSAVRGAVRESGQLFIKEKLAEVLRHTDEATDFLRRSTCEVVETNEAKP